MEELFELIYFFIPLALILFFRFFSNRNARANQANQSSDSPGGSRGEPTPKPGSISNFLTNAGNQVREFLGLPSEPSSQNQSSSSSGSPGGQKRTVPNIRSAKSIASTMYRTGSPSEQTLVTTSNPNGSQPKKTMQIRNDTSLKGLKKIQRLPELQKAIIWNELLNKPKGW